MELLKNQRTPALAETMAMAQAELGRFKDAVEWQRTAIDLARSAGRPEGMAHLTEITGAVRSGRPCRTPWTTMIPCIIPVRLRRAAASAAAFCPRGLKPALYGLAAAAVRLAVKLVSSLTLSLLLLAALGSRSSRARSSWIRPATPASEFTHINGASGELLLPEVIGSGGAVFDYDNDGDLDVFLVQGATLRPDSAGAAHGPSARSRLYRNDRGLNGDARLRFTDVTDRSGLVATGNGMGAATGDFDNDGWIDLYVTFLGSSRSVPQWRRRHLHRRHSSHADRCSGLG
jgi:hypothetical protein